MSQKKSKIQETTDNESRGYRSFRLSSGLRVVLYFDDSPVSYAGYFVGAGSSNDPHRYYGMAHFVEHMLFKGTEKRNARQIINRMEEVGADFNAFTTKEETYIYTSFPFPYFHRVLDMMTDVVCHSCAPKEELLKEREVIIEEINSYLDSPADSIFDEYENLLFHGTPLGHNILGSIDSVKRITTQNVIDFVQKNYTASNLLFCYRGKEIDLNELFDFLNLNFPTNSLQFYCNEDLPKGELSLSLPLQQEVTHRYNTYQVHCIMGCPAYSFQNKEKRLGLILLNNILGGNGMNSRLNLNLREDKGLVYTVESNYSPYKQTGILSIYFGTTKAKLKKARESVKDEISRLCEVLIPEVALRAAKRQIIGQMIVRDDSRESVFLSLARSHFYFNSYNNIEKIKESLDSITSEKLLSIAQEIFKPSHLLTLTYL